MNVLDTANDREQFTASLIGKRILHVKGFGSGFKNPTDAQVELEAKQKQEAVNAIMQFNPDYLVVDGDPWGEGFQQHIKAFCDLQRESGNALPQLIWAKHVAISSSEGGIPTDADERSKYVKKAEQWMEHNQTTVIVYWIDYSHICAKMDALYGEGTAAKLEPEKFSARGVIRILSDDVPSWVSGSEPGMLDMINAMEDPAREGQQFFEKCSFENSAKGNVIYEALRVPKSTAHGVVSFGGGESVMLELATKYLNPKSGFDPSNAAVFPHSRGKEESDPKLPQHLGAAFAMGKDPA